MADGSGTPEQLKMTYNRFNRFLPENNILVITLDRFAKTAREVLPTLPQENLLVEPVGRKTAPCMAFACYTLLSRDPEAVVVATPWDLYIRDEALFAQTISDAFEYVEKNPDSSDKGEVTPWDMYGTKTIYANSAEDLYKAVSGYLSGSSAYATGNSINYEG